MLLIAGLQCLIWGLAIMLLPDRASIVYGFTEPPRDHFLWQGTGLVIFLYGIGYTIAASNPQQHWAVILIGLMAKILGPIGMVWSVESGSVPAKVLLLIPINDAVWWIPFGVILWQVYSLRREGC